MNCDAHQIIQWKNWNVSTDLYEIIIQEKVYL